MQASTIEINAAMAKAWLAKSTYNRPIDLNNVRKITNSILDGRWKLNGECMILTPEGIPVNCHHRLISIVEADKKIPGITIKSLVTFDGDHNTFDTIDSGKNRTQGDYAALAGVDPSKSTTVAELAKFTLSEKSHFKCHPGEPTTQKLLATIEANRGDFEWAADVAITYKKAASGRFSPPLSRGIAAYLIFKLRKAGHTDENIALFFNSIKTRANLPENSPIFALLSLFQNAARMKRMISSNQKIVLTLKVFNAWALGKTMIPGNLRSTDTEELPVIVNPQFLQFKQQYMEKA